MGIGIQSKVQLSYGRIWWSMNLHGDIENSTADVSVVPDEEGLGKSKQTQMRGEITCISALNNSALSC